MSRNKHREKLSKHKHASPPAPRSIDGPVRDHLHSMTEPPTPGPVEPQVLSGCVVRAAAQQAMVADYGPSQAREPIEPQGFTHDSGFDVGYPPEQLHTIGDIEHVLVALGLRKEHFVINLVGPGFVSILVPESEVETVRRAIFPRQLIMTKIEVAALLPDYNPVRYQK